MTKGEIKQWLDALIEAEERYESIRNVYYEDGVWACTLITEKRLHIFAGIEKIAELIGADIIKRERKIDDYYEIEYSFKYRDYTVFQLGEKVCAN